MRGPGVPSVEGPCLADQAADGDDRVGEVEERVDDLLAALVAALQPVEGVVPGVGPLDVPALPGLDRGLVALMGDVAGHAAGGQFIAGLARVLTRRPGKELHVTGQRPELAETGRARGASSGESLRLAGA